MVQVNEALADGKLARVAFRERVLFYRCFTHFETHPSYDTLVLSLDLGVRLLSTALALAVLATGVWAQDKKKDPINSRMGLNTWAAFFGSDANAEIAGDIAMLGSEVTPVLKALRMHGLDVVAIHQHMIGTQPAIYFLHYWGTGPADRLATGFRAALDELGTKSTRSALH